MQCPLAIVAIDDLLTSTLLKLVLLPVRYRWFDRERVPRCAYPLACHEIQF